MQKRTIIHASRRLADKTLHIKDVSEQCDFREHIGRAYLKIELIHSTAAEGL